MTSAATASRRGRLGLLAAVLLVVPVLTATPAAAIIGGQPDGTGHPYVAMLFAPGASAPSCSGVLTRADNGAVAVLTAAHCLTGGAGPATGRGWQVEFSAVHTASSPRYTGTYYVARGYQPSVSRAHDLAAIVLTAGPTIQPAELGAPGREDNQPDRFLTVVGAGQPFVGQRRSATERVVGRDGTWLYLVPGSGNSCDGDSGGPDLVPATRVVVALTDQGSCSTDQDLRVDTVEAHQFLVSATQAAGAPTISMQPAAQTVPAGQAAQFSAAASPADASVQWQVSADGGTSFTDLAGQRGATLSVTPEPPQSGAQYRAVFTDPIGVATTDPATLTVTTAPGSGTAGLFHPLVPSRILDTRSTRAPVTASADRLVPVLGVGGVPTSGVAAVVLAAVVALPPSAGDLEIFPTGQRPSPRTSNLNWPARRTVANLVTVPVGAGGTVALSTSAPSTDVALDVVGWYGDSSNQSGARYTPLTATRILDTGDGSGNVAAGADRRVVLRGVGGVPAGSDVRAVALNLTVLGAQGPTDVEVYPTGARARARTSNTNLVAGQTASVAVVATLGVDGSVELSAARGTVRALVDVVGYFSATGDRFVPLAPVRVVDRIPVRGGSDQHVVLAGSHGIPADADAVLFNLTGVGATRDLDVEVFASGDRPVRRTSVLNLRPGEAVPNLVAARLGAGAIELSVSIGEVRFILDAFGYFTNR